MSLSTIHFQLPTGVFNARILILVFGKVCLLAAVLLLHGIADKLRRAEKISLPTREIQLSDDGSADTTSASLQAFSVIKTRNIFGQVNTTATPTATEAPKPVTPLKLRLVGTQVPSKGRPYAIVEDSQKKKQDVFELNEMIFDQAKLVSVDGESIQIERNGTIEVLLMEDGSSTGAATGISSNEDQTEFTVAESELTDALANLPRLLSQARAVPYFRNGKSIGMRLFAIRRGSLYEKLGLKNGDIVLAVNENSLNDPTQALKLFEQLKTERSINVQLERGGQTSDLRYNVR